MKKISHAVPRLEDVVSIFAAPPRHTCSRGLTLQKKHAPAPGAATLRPASVARRGGRHLRLVSRRATIVSTGAAAACSGAPGSQLRLISCARPEMSEARGRSPVFPPRGAGWPGQGAAELPGLDDWGSLCAGHPKNSGVSAAELHGQAAIGKEKSSLSRH